MHTIYLVDDYEFDRQELERFVYDYIVENERYDALPRDVQQCREARWIKRRISGNAFRIVKRLGFNAICIQNFI